MTSISEIFSLDQLQALAQDEHVQQLVAEYLRAVAKNGKQASLNLVYSKLPEPVKKLLTSNQIKRLLQSPDQPVQVRVKVEEQSGNGIGAVLGAIANVGSQVAAKAGPILAQIAAKAAPIMSNSVVKALALGGVTAIGQKAMSDLMGNGVVGSRYHDTPLALTEAQLGRLGTAARNDHESHRLQLSNAQLSSDSNVLIPLTQRQINQISKALDKGVGCRLTFSRAQLRDMKRQFEIQDGEGIFRDENGETRFSIKNIQKVLDSVDKGSKKARKVLDAISDPVD